MELQGYSSEPLAKDYVFQVKVRNGPMLKVMRANGFENASELSRASNVNPSHVGLYLNLRKSPLKAKRSGDAFGETWEWRDDIIRIASVLRVPPESLFPDQHLMTPLEKNAFESTVSLGEIESLGFGASPEDLLLDAERIGLIPELLESLDARERDIVESRFGLNGDPRTLEDLSLRYGVPRERIRNLEVRSLRKLKGALARKEKRSARGINGISQDSIDL